MVKYRCVGSPSRFFYALFSKKYVRNPAKYKIKDVQPVDGVPLCIFLWGLHPCRVRESFFNDVQPVDISVTPK